MGKATSSSSSSMSSSSNRHRNRHHLVLSTASSDLSQQLPTDLSLGLAMPFTTTHHHNHHHQQQQHHFASSRGQWEQQQQMQMQMHMQGEWGSENGSMFVKVYMEGIPIGRKLNILAHHSYHELVSTLENMFDTTILWGTEMDGVQPERCHVLTYEDEEGDLVMVGDVPWEMFVSTVRRLKITRVDAFGC